MSNPGDIRVEPDQWEPAIADTDGPQLVVAGPGTGKTEFLVKRARHLIATRTVTPAEILILTFSRRAAAEISDRTAEWGSPVTATFHAFARRLLEAHGPWTGPDMPALLTGPEQIALVSELLRSEDPGLWPPPYRPLLGSGTLAEEVADFLLRCRERLLGAADIESRVPERPQWAPLPAFMRRFDLELVARNRIDYATLISLALDMLRQPTIRQTVAHQYRYVLVDEYQDTSPAQARLLELLTADHRNITVTGDPYQSIYSFRGADLNNIAAFPDRFRDDDGKPARRLVLTTSFRVPRQILDSALRVVAGGDLPGSAGPVEPASHPGQVETYVFDQASAEADWIASEIERLHRHDRLDFDKMAVLIRSTRHLLPELSRSLERRRIPHNVPDRRLVDHPAVRMIFDLVVAAGAANTVTFLSSGLEEETDRAIRRLLLGPLLSLPLGQERDLLRRRRRTGTPWDKILSDAGIGSPQLVSLLADSDWAVAMPAADGFWTAWTSLPEIAALVEQEARSDYRRAWSAFAQALDQMNERDPRITLDGYRLLASDEGFEATTLLSFQKTRSDAVTLTTLHQAKGLEFDVVFIADASEGVFPDLRRSRALLRPEYLTPGSTPETAARFRLQEEMRLAYTAMARARQRVIWTATAAAIDEGERRPSRFLLAAAGASSFDQLGPPARAHRRPWITPGDAQAALRRLVTDPSAPAPDRMAAAAVLASPPGSLWDAASFAGVAERGPDTGVIQTPLRLSPSAAQSYSECPRRYVFERQLESSDQFSPWAHFGTLIHSVLELAEAEAIAGGRDHAQVDDACNHLDAVWTQDADFGSPVLNRAWLSKGRELIEQLYAKWPGGDARGVGAERRMTTELGGITWTGRIDRIETHRRGELRIVDYKTGSQQLSVSEAASSLQLGFYLLAAATDPELTAIGQPTAAELWHVQKLQPRRSFEIENLGAVETELVRIGRAIAAEDWTATPGEACKRCSVRSVCPAWPEGREAFRP